MFGSITVTRKIGSSLRIGSWPPKARAYLNRLRTPEPSSSAHCISRNSRAMAGFFGDGAKSSGRSRPMPWGLLLFSVVTRSRWMISLAGNGLRYSRWISRLATTSRKIRSRRLTRWSPSR
ncbi:hypothetical protein D3C71_1892030 [compost metagenome]